MYNYCKTCCHDDGDTGFCDKCYYNHILEEKGIAPTEYEAKPKPITNADAIRAMPDEELATYLDNMQGLAYINGFDSEPIRLYPNNYGAWLDWLRQEAGQCTK